MAEFFKYQIINSLLNNFHREMRNSIHSATEDKGTSWQETSVVSLNIRLSEKIDEYTVALNQDDFELAMRKLVVIANYAMMIWNNIENGRGL